MDKLPAASEEWKLYAVDAHKIGLTVRAIIEDLNTYGHVQVTTEDVRASLKDIGRPPKFTYPLYDGVMKAMNGQNSAGIQPFSSWSSRYILNRKSNNDTNSTIFAKMRRRGYEILGEDLVQAVLEEHQFIDDELARGCDTHDNSALGMIIVKAHDWGYTVLEIARQIFGSTNGRKSAININKVKKALESNGIPEGQHRNGRKLEYVGRNVRELRKLEDVKSFMKSAYNLGMDVNSIRDQLYVHGFDHSDSNPIVDLLKSNGVWQEQNPERARPSQAAQPTQPKACEDVHPMEEQVASRSARANEEPSRSISVGFLLN